MLDNRVISGLELSKYIYSLKNYVVSEYVQQHKYSQEINTSSLNRFGCCVLGC